jgi:hypothetical protein
MNDPHFDSERAASLVGKHLIIGLTVHDREDTPIDQIQLHGDIVRVNQPEGVVVRLHPSGVEYAMPAVLAAYEPAPPGDYQFSASGEVVRDPDLMTTWVVYEPESWEEEQL